MFIQKNTTVNSKVSQYFPQGMKLIFVTTHILPHLYWYKAMAVIGLFWTFSDKDKKIAFYFRTWLPIVNSAYSGLS